VITVLAVGIGSGNPAHLTAEAVAALNRVDVFLVADKRADTRDLAAIRGDLCRAVIMGDGYRVIEVAAPPRDRDASGYREAVVDWHARRAATYAEVIGRERILAGSDCGFGTFAGFGPVHPSVGWMKLKSLAEGAAIASKKLWGKAGSAS